MAGKGAVLAVRIVSDASGAKKGFADAAKGAADLEGATRKAGVATDAAGRQAADAGGRMERFKGGLDKASAAAGLALAGIGALGKACFDAASDAQQATGAVEAVFGDMAAKVTAASGDAAQTFGLSAAEFNNSAALMGAQLQNMGFSADAAWDQTNSLIGLGSDLAAQYGGTTQEAVEALSSALKGERDPIERYAVSLSQAAIDAQVAAMHLDTHSDAAKRNADAQATLALISEQAGSAQGAFSREADTAAGATQRAGAEFENAKASLGEVLLPIVADAAQKFSDLTGWLVQNKDVVIPLAGGIAALALAVIAVNAAVSAWQAMVKLATALQIVWNLVLSANPLGLIVLGVMAVVGVVILMYNKFEWFRDLIGKIGDFFGWVWDKIKEGIAWVADKLEWLGDAASWVGDLFSSAAINVPVTPVATGGLAGMFGSAGTVGVFGASGSALSGAGSSAGQGSGGGNVVVNVNVRDAIDPVATGRTLERILRQYARATGSQVALNVGAR